MVLDVQSKSNKARRVQSHQACWGILLKNRKPDTSAQTQLGSRNNSADLRKLDRPQTTRPIHVKQLGPKEYGKNTL